MKARLCGLAVLFGSLWLFGLFAEHGRQLRHMPLGLGFPLIALCIIGLTGAAIIGAAVMIVGVAEDDEQPES